MRVRHAAASRVTTIHLVYPHGRRISTPDAIGRNLGARLERRYRVVYYDWDARGVIEPQPGDALVGHPHPSAATIFRRSARLQGWERVLMISPYNGDLAQVSFLDGVIRDCDRYLAITGSYWFALLPTSAFSHWAAKMIRLDLAIDRTDYPPVKSAFNPPGKRRFVYIGHAARSKNTSYLGAIARMSPGVEFGWIGGRGTAIPGVIGLGWRDFAAPATQELVAGYDFLVTVGRADANPTTVLEAMAWGLIPVCTPQSGYANVPGIVNVPLDDAAGAAAVIRRLQALPDEELRRMQASNWEVLDRAHTWDRFAALVTDALESHESPSLGHESLFRRARLGWAAATSPQTSRVGHMASRVRARLKAGGRTREWHRSSAPGTHDLASPATASPRAGEEAQE